MKIIVPIVNAFIDGDWGGNPAGVILDAQKYTHEQRQKIAAAVGLSETAFVSPSTTADFKLDFYTPTLQIAHCGHATIATFSYLGQQGLLPRSNTSKETIDGRREIMMEGDVAFMEQVAPTYTRLGGEERDKVYASLGMDVNESTGEAVPCIVNTGNGFLIQELRNEAEVKAIDPQIEQISQISASYDLIGYYIFSRDTATPGRDAGARMFAPRYGINEEAATGMAAGPLACYLRDQLKIDKGTFVIEQGHLMASPSPSIIIVNLKIRGGSISGLMAGGKAKVSGFREIEI